MSTGRVQGRREQSWDILIMPTTDELDERLNRVEDSQAVILAKLSVITRLVVALVFFVVAHIGLEFMPSRGYSDLAKRLEAAETRAVLEPYSD